MKILLYSTGLDSELYRLLTKPDKLIFFKSGARYEQQEINQLRKFISNGLVTEEVIVDDTLKFASLERADAIVPMRNIFYLLRAFEYGDNVSIGVTYYDLHYDKQPDVLGGLISFIQTYYYGREIPVTWDNMRPYINIEYNNYTKADLLKHAIEKNINVRHIPTLRTCYDAHSEKGCGRCKSCVQKAIALAVNGMFEPELFDNDPRIVGAKWYKNYLQECEGTIDPEIFLEELTHLLEYR